MIYVLYVKYAMPALPAISAVVAADVTAAMAQDRPIETYEESRVTGGESRQGCLWLIEGGCSHRCSG